MRGPVSPNFRGARALIAQAACAGRETLATTLGRLGLQVAFHDDPATADAPPFDVLFSDADEGLIVAAGDTPQIALIGLEAPSRLLRVVRQRCVSYLIKPVRPTGVFTALFIAFNEHACRRRESAERAALNQRLSGRRHVIKAVLSLMQDNGVDDDEAFRLLRAEAMRRRLSVEASAAALIAARDASAQHPRAAGRSGEITHLNRR